MSKSKDNFIDHQMELLSGVQIEALHNYSERIQQAQEVFDSTLYQLKQQALRVNLEFLSQFRLTKCVLIEFDDFPYYACQLSKSTTKLHDLQGKEGKVVFEGIGNMAQHEFPNVLTH